MSLDLREALATVSTFPDLLEALHLAHFSGAITLHFYAGMPHHVDLPAPPPERIPLTSRPSARNRGLTTPVPSPHSIA